MFRVIYELVCLVLTIVHYYAREAVYMLLRNRPQKKINAESVLITGQLRVKPD